MSDTPTDAPAESPQEQQPDDTDWKAEAKKWETRSKANLTKARENEAAAQRLAELEEASKTDLERWQARAEQAEQRLHAFESERQITAWKTETAETVGVPARLLRGSTLEEIQAHAEDLKTELGVSRRDRAYVPGAGNQPTSPADQNSQFLEQIFGRGQQ